ncbi:unnamed protein product [Cuscuta epithymum]|uniref:Reverse transcriptase Ty1/copia-type domain-containing protein n=1 Tax=Cuscuta epithymum TaxID=186058 RepID=A0AAV0FTT2_9ASTE|nr:unnamed protein product [Cuscuta epithymum]CAH9139024.1 unnamed protein product [Cuscuta epithymum]
MNEKMTMLECNQSAMEIWLLHYLDIKFVILQSELIQEVYMESLPGFVTQRVYCEFVCRLHKSLYEYMQTPRAWHTRFNYFIKQLGMFRSEKDHRGSKEKVIKK